MKEHEDHEHSTTEKYSLPSRELLHRRQ